MWPDPDHPASWSVTDYLLATVIDCVRENTYVTALAAGAKHVEKPKPSYRPGRRPAGGPRAVGASHNGTKVSWGELAGFLMRGGQ